MFWFRKLSRCGAAVATLTVMTVVLVYCYKHPATATPGDAMRPREDDLHSTSTEDFAEDEVEEVDIPLWDVFSPNDVKTDRDIFFIETSG